MLAPPIIANSLIGETAAAPHEMNRKRESPVAHHNVRLRPVAGLFCSNSGLFFSAKKKRDSDEFAGNSIWIKLLEKYHSFSHEEVRM